MQSLVGVSGLLFDRFSFGDVEDDPDQTGDVFLSNDSDAGAWGTPLATGLQSVTPLLPQTAQVAIAARSGWKAQEREGAESQALERVRRKS